MANPLKSDKEFNDLMIAIDARLKDKGVPIHARQLHALAEAAKLLDQEIIGGPLSTGPIPGVYEGESLSAHIIQWMEHRYGERLKVDLSIGYAPILIRDDPWLLKYPLILGTVTVVCDRDLTKKYSNISATIPGEAPQKPVMNLLANIIDLPHALAKELTDSELRDILNIFVVGHEFYTVLDSRCRSDDLAMLALSDLNNGAKMAVGTTANHGQSAWSSLQAAEKLLKLFIQKHDGSYPHTHSLNKLYAHASRLGLPHIEAEILSSAQCSSNVRYERTPHDAFDAVSAHHAAMNIGSAVVLNLFAGADDQTAQ